MLRCAVERAVLTAILLFAGLDPAFATSKADSFGRILCNARESLGPLVLLVGALAYITALIMATKGVYLLKRHSEAPSQQGLSAGLYHLLVAGALASLPTFVAVLQKTMGLVSSTTTSGCTPGAVGDADALDVMMQNFTNNIAQPMMALISALAVAVGVFYVFKGLMAASKIGSDPRSSATHVILANIIIGAILISIGGMVPTIMETLFGFSSITKMSTFSGIQWSKIDPDATHTAAADKTVRAILMFIQVIGGIAFLRGWMMLKKAAEGGQATIAQAFTHIIGGAMAINIGAMLSIMDKTFGTGMIQ